MRSRTLTPPKWLKKDDKFITIYKGVCRYVHPHHGHEWFSARIGKTYESYHDTELEAARQVDRVRMSKGMQPINTFKVKTSDLSDLNP